MVYPLVGELIFIVNFRNVLESNFRIWCEMKRRGVKEINVGPFVDELDMLFDFDDNYGFKISGKILEFVDRIRKKCIWDLDEFIGVVMRLMDNIDKFLMEVDMCLDVIE